MAFNALALGLGVEYVLDPRFNPVRDYIKRPKRGEAWPFAEARYRGPEIRMRRLDADGGEVIAMDLLFSTYAVALTPHTDFVAVARKHGLHLVEPSVKTPAPAELTYIEH